MGANCIFIENYALINSAKNVIKYFTIIMKKKLQAVKEFHEAFGLGVKNEPTAQLPSHLLKLRFNLMAEENDEYFEAAQKNDLVEVADALGDMLYILCGTILEHGLQHKIEEVFDEIQRSNMSKLGTNGQPIYREDGKVMKGPNYFKPNIGKILDK
jgi:predicted HAD superfamily Cof-like phosphohydrolase